MLSAAEVRGDAHTRSHDCDDNANGDADEDPDRCDTEDVVVEEPEQQTRHDAPDEECPQPEDRAAVERPLTAGIGRWLVIDVVV
jgi:hypothetical protein